MENEVNRNDIKETVTRVSIRKKVNADAKKALAEAEKFMAEAKQILANIEINKKNQEIETELKYRNFDKELVEEKIRLNRAEMQEKESIAFNMLILTNIMTKKFGEGESWNTARLFSDNELIEYKAKMKELLNSL